MVETASAIIQRIKPVFGKKGYALMSKVQDGFEDTYEFIMHCDDLATASKYAARYDNADIVSMESGRLMSWIG